MKISERIEQLRNLKGIQQKELAIALEVGQSTVSHWESGRQEPNPVQRMKLCKFFGITEAELFGPVRIEVRDIDIPIVSSTGATDDLGKTYFTPYEPPYKKISFKNCKAVVVESNSMAPIAYKGQKIIYCEDASIKNGDLVFVKLRDGSQIFKRYYKNHDSIISLQSVNVAEAHEPIVKKDKDIEFCYKVVGVSF